MSQDNSDAVGDGQESDLPEANPTAGPDSQIPLQGGAGAQLPVPATDDDHVFGAADLSAIAEAQAKRQASVESHIARVMSAGIPPALRPSQAQIRQLAADILPAASGGCRDRGMH